MKKSILMSALAAQATFGAEAAEPVSADFEATHLRHSGTVRVDASPRESFQLFTAPGEKLWAAGWNPEVLHGGDGRQKGAVFVTTHGDEETLWLVVDFDPEAFHVRYARITPSARAGSVEVRVRSDGHGGSLAQVTYQLTALNEAGNRQLAEFDSERYARMMVEWEDAISAADIDYRLLTGDR